MPVEGKDLLEGLRNNRRRMGFNRLQFPFGRPLGEPGNADQQRVMIQDPLGVLMDAKEPGALRALPYRWRREDYAAILKQREGA